MPFVVALIAAAFLGWQVTRLLRHAGWVTHTEEVTAAINRTQKLVIDQETGLRGYLLTGNRIFLQPYMEADPEVLPSIATLRALVADNEAQVERTAQLEERYRTWIKLADVTQKAPAPELYRPEDLQKEMVSRKAMMDSIRTIVASMLKEETGLLGERRADIEHVRTETLTVSSALVLALALLMAFASRRWILAVDRSYRAALEERRRTEERERAARLAAEGLAAEIQEQASVAEASVVTSMASCEEAKKRVADLEAELARMRGGLAAT